MLGSFLALDLVLFFAFFEVALIPMWFVINGWGDRHDEPGRRRAATRFLVFTVLGSALMLVGFVLVRSQAGTFDIVQIAATYQPSGAAGGHRGRARRARPGREDAAVAAAHLAPRRALQGARRSARSCSRRCCSSSAPTASSGSGCRWPTRPGGCSRRSSPALAVVGIVYAALACLAQTDLKRLIAYSSVGHMGFVVLAVATFTVGGVQAAVFASVAHGLITGLLFFLAGAIKDRYGTGDLRPADACSTARSRGWRRCSRSRRWPRSACPGWPGSGARCWRSGRRVYPGPALPGGRRTWCSR